MTTEQISCTGEDGEMQLKVAKGPELGLCFHVCS